MSTVIKLPQPVTSLQSTTQQTTDTTAQPLTLDTSKDYGDKYADGVLPVGDNKMVTDAAKTGYIYGCSQYAQNQKTCNAGAETRGPWFTNNNTEYDLNKKLAVQGNKTWNGSFSNQVERQIRALLIPMTCHPTAPARSRYPAAIQPTSTTATPTRLLPKTSATACRIALSTAHHHIAWEASLA